MITTGRLQFVGNKLLTTDIMYRFATEGAREKLYGLRKDVHLDILEFRKEK